MFSFNPVESGSYSNFGYGNSRRYGAVNSECNHTYGMVNSKGQYAENDLFGVLFISESKPDFISMKSSFILIPLAKNTQYGTVQFIV